MDNTTLAKLLQKSPFTFREALEAGLTRSSLQTLLEKGAIERISRGVYQCVDIDPSEEELFKRAMKIVGQPSAICLLSALSYFGLTDTIPTKVWVMVPADKRSKSSEVHLYRSRNPRWDVGVENANGFSITNLERSLVDSLSSRTKLPTRLGIEALKFSISDGRTTTGHVLEMANRLQVKDRILPYLEVLS